MPLRVVGDVHGDSRAFALAAETDRYIVQLGDLVDDGPDTPGALAIMFRLIDEQRGMFLLGNHDYKLARGLLGHHVSGDSVERSLDELPLAMHRRTLKEIMDAPAWVATPRALFVHGGFHPAMRRQAPPPFPTRRPDPLVARALFGQTTGRATAAGRPERLLDWIEEIPAGITVYCGHDRRSQDGRPYIRDNAAGGRAVFLDTGAGKGGHLSWMDIDPV
jgi:protein phosphatase